MLKQRTLRNSIKAVGIGLHTGQNINMELIPAEVNTGINFIRTDVDENLVIPAVAQNVGDTSLSTALVKNNVKISTIEHLMGALFGLGIDNAFIEINNKEVPILDGSAKEFIEILKSCGLEKSEVPIKIIKIQNKISYYHGEKFISIEPSKLSLDINFKLKFEDCLIGNQENEVKTYEIGRPDLSESFGNKGEERNNIGFKAYCFGRKQFRSFRHDRIVSITKK